MVRSVVGVMINWVKWVYSLIDRSIRWAIGLVGQGSVYSFSDRSIRSAIGLARSAIGLLFVQPSVYLVRALVHISTLAQRRRLQCELYV